MNILVVAHYQNDGFPTAIFIHEQILAYRHLGHSVRVVVPIALGKRGFDGRRLEPAVCRREIDGIPHYFIRHFSISNFGKKHFNTATAVHVLQANLDAVLNGFTPDIIHAHTLGLDSDVGVWLKERLGCPLVVTTHGSDTSIPMEHGRGTEMKELCDPVDTVVAVSSVLADKLRTCGTTTRICSVLNGFQSHILPVETQKIPLSFIQVGHLLEQKRFHITIQAFASFQKQYPEAVLTIIGQGPEREHLESLCGELGVENAVRFLGQVSNEVVLTEMAKARFFVMPSVREGFGIVYLEAMASGCVTIGTEGEGIADLIVSGENGFLVPPDDPDAIVRVVEWCLAHPARADAIAERGKKDAQALTWEKNAAQYIELFDFLINGEIE